MATIDVFQLISAKILAPVNALISQAGTVAGWVAPIVATVMIIKIIFYGINVWNGTAKASVVDVAKDQIKPFIVLVCMLAGGAFTSNVIGFFTDVRNSFTGLFSGSGLNSYAALDAAAGKAIDLVTKAYEPIEGAWTIMTIPTGAIWNVLMLSIYTVMVFIYGAYATVVLLFIDFSLVFIWIVGPLFIAFMAFNATQSLSTSWLSAAFKYTFNAIIIAFITGVANSIMTTFVQKSSDVVGNDTASIFYITMAAIGSMLILFGFIKTSSQLASDVTGGLALSFGSMASAALKIASNWGGATAGFAGRGAGSAAGGALSKAGGSLSGSNNSARASIGRGMAGLGKAMQQPAITRAAAKADTKKKTNMISGSSTASVVNGAGYAGAQATSLAGAGVSALGRGAQSLGKKIFDANASKTGASGAVARGAGGLLYGSGALADKAGKAASYIGDSFSGDSAKASLSKNSAENYIQAAKPPAANATSNSAKSEAVVPAKAGSPVSNINTANSQSETPPPASDVQSKVQTPQAVSSAIASSAASQAEPTITTAPRSSSSTIGSSIQAKSISPSSPPPSRGRQNQQRKTLKAKAGQAIANAGRSMSQSVAADSQAPGRVVPAASKLKANLGNALDKIGSDLSQFASKNVSRRTVNRETK